ncbi:MAG: SDR family oxidoreductase [Polyangiaceae bacterium]
MTQSNSPIALITGGSRGLGRSMALHLADRGVDLVITYNQNSAAADEVVKQAEAKGRKAVALQLDASDTASFGAFAERLQSELSKTFGRERFDYLVNNAGTGLHKPLAETTEAEFDSMMKLHVKGPFFFTQKLLPLLNDGGRILNISSGLARFTLPGYGAYAMMKGAIEVLTRYQAKELGDRKITVNTLAPGAIETDFGGGTVRDNKQVNAMVASMTTLGRVGLPDDVGAAVAMLLSPDSAWITAQRIEVSGGQSI